ncbi:MAG: 50S ribosomal protein L6 [Candidatus Gastranaerophilales bacterium]|nr:50S ribosomal protein L6 [Candidatus Gastranaerophilales bacterium]
MSRIGKLPVAIPEGVEVTINGQTITAKGPLGTETVEIRSEIKAEKSDNSIILTRESDDRKARSLHGLSRTLVANVVNGVKTGFVKKLEIVGVGYRAAMQGNTLNLALGYSHPIDIPAPEGIKIAVEQNTKITITGANKQAVGDIAALIRSKRPPEVYKGKGVKYEGEHIRRKAGKTGKK